MASDTHSAESFVRGYSGRIFILLTTGFLGIKTVQYLLPPLLPLIIENLEISPFEAGITITVMSISRAVFQLPSGRYSDRLSRKTPIVIALVISIAALSLLLLSTSYEIFLVGVAIYGVSAGIFDPADRALISDLFSRRRGHAFGIHMTFGDLAGVFAAGLTITLVELVSWQFVFLPSLLILIPVLLFYEHFSSEKLFLSTVSLDMIGTASRLFKDSQIRWLLIAYSLFVFGTSGAINFLPTFLAVEGGFSFTMASSSFAAFYIVGVIVKPLSGYMSDRFPRPMIAAGALFVSGIGLFILTEAYSLSLVASGVLLFAVGQRSFPPPMQAYLMDVFPDTSMGSDLGAVRTFYLGVGSLGPGYVGYVASVANYTVAFSSIVFCFLLGGAIVFWKRA